MGEGIFKPFGKNYTFTEDEMNQMSEILITADEIRTDKRLFELVKKYMEEKKNKITKIQDLRDISNGCDPRKNLT